MIYRFSPIPAPSRRCIAPAACCKRRGSRRQARRWRSVLPIVHRLVDSGIPVMGHLGFYAAVGTSDPPARPGPAIVCRAPADRGCAGAGAGRGLCDRPRARASPLASAISERLHIPTIGIGAGAGCDGQVQIWHDLLGATTDFLPRHAKRYAHLAEIIGTALQSYAADCARASFPPRSTARRWTSRSYSGGARAGRAAVLRADDR